MVIIPGHLNCIKIANSFTYFDLFTDVKIWSLEYIVIENKSWLVIVHADKWFWHNMTEDERNILTVFLKFC